MNEYRKKKEALKEKLQIVANVQEIIKNSKLKENEAKKRSPNISVSDIELSMIFFNVCVREKRLESTHRFFYNYHFHAKIGTKCFLQKWKFKMA